MKYKIIMRATTQQQHPDKVILENIDKTDEIESLVDLASDYQNDFQFLVVPMETENSSIPGLTQYYTDPEGYLLLNVHEYNLVRLVPLNPKEETIIFPVDRFRKKIRDTIVYQSRVYQFKQTLQESIWFKEVHIEVVF